MSTSIQWIVAVVVAVAVTAFAAPAARAAQEEQFTPEFKAVRSAADPKHTPKIVAPDVVKRGQWFDVTVSVGAGGDHPSLSEHYVRYIALYINSAEISRVYLHPVFSFPKVTFTIALDEGGTLTALEEPTHSAAWEASKPIKVTP
jgi:superoxide reductase